MTWIKPTQAPPRSPYLPPLCACPEEHPSYPASDVLCCTRDKFAVAGFGNVVIPATPIQPGEFRQLKGFGSVSTADAPLTSTGITSVSTYSAPVTGVAVQPARGHSANSGITDVYTYSPPQSGLRIPLTDLGSMPSLPSWLQMTPKLGSLLGVGALLFVAALGYRLTRQP